MPILQKEGRIENVVSWLPFYHPNKKNEERGRLKISMTIIPKVEADNNPVGEA